MLRNPLPVSVILTAVLVCGFPHLTGAQEIETESREAPASSDREQAGGKASPGRRRDRSPPSMPPLDDFEELEEVLVTADRIEGSGGRGRATVGRDELERTDQTDMEGFFDDIDGISTLGGDGEGNAFSIDGLSPDLGKVTLNGQGLGEGRGNGGFGAGDLPPDMILRVDVLKTPSAAMEEGGGGGRVNLQLRNPVDIATPSTSIKGRLGYVPDTDNLSPSASFFAGRPSESKKSGFMVSVNLTDRVNRHDSQDVSNWVLRDFDGTPAFIPDQLRNSVVQNDRGNLFAGLAVGFRPHPSLDISGKLFLSQKQHDTENHSLQHRIEKQRDILALAFDERIVSELDSTDRSRRNLRVAGSTREDQTDSLILGMDFTWRNAGWRVDGAAGYSMVESNSHTPSQTVIFDTNSAFGYRAGADGSLVTSYADHFPANRDFAISRINLSERNTEDSNRFGGVDATRQLGEGFMRRIRFGGKFREMTRDRRSLTGRVSLDDGLTLADFSSGLNEQTPWDTAAWPTIDLERVNALVLGSPVEWEENLRNEYDIRQRTNAGYIQADFRKSLAEQRFLVGNIGARIVGTDTWIAGYQDNGETTEPVSRKTSYTDILPSISMRMRIAGRAGLTLGVARVMTHPAFNDLAPGVRLNHSDKTARSGNPDLRPFRANQYLAELTWAPERGRRLSGKLTYRDVKSYFASGEDSIEIDGDTYLLTRPINGDDGYILTASVKLDQNLRRLTRRLQNFALSVAYTHNRSRTDMSDPYSGEELPLPNTAEYVVKADLSYVRETFAGKLSYQWRGKSLKSSFSDSGLSVWNQAVGSLNLNLGWRLNERLQLGFDARNLLSEEQIQTSDNRGQLWRISERDRSLAATLRVKW